MPRLAFAASCAVLLTAFLCPVLASDPSARSAASLPTSPVPVALLENPAAATLSNLQVDPADSNPPEPEARYVPFQTTSSRSLVY